MRKKDEAMVISFDLDVDLLADFTEDHVRSRPRHPPRAASTPRAAAAW